MATYTLNRKALQAAIQAAGLTADQFTTAVGISEEELFDDSKRIKGMEAKRLLGKIAKVLGVNGFDLLLGENGFDLFMEKEGKSP